MTVSFGCNRSGGQRRMIKYYSRLPKLGKSDQAGLISLARPVPDGIGTGRAVIDSIRKINYRKGLALLVYGKLPNSCSNLYKAHTRILNDTLFIRISTWQLARTGCATLPVPFRYAYAELPPAEFEGIKVYKTGNGFHRFRF